MAVPWTKNLQSVYGCNNGAADKHYGQVREPGICGMEPGFHKRNAARCDLDGRM